MMKKLTIILSALILVACGNDRNYQFFNGHAQGTTYHLIVESPTPGIEAKIQEVFNLVDSTMSIFNPNSLISKINRNEAFETDLNINICMGTAKSAYIISKGAYDVTIAPLANLWGFGPDGKPEVQPTEQQIDSVMEFVGHDRIAVMYNRIFKDDPRTQIDLSSVAKGRTVDLMCEMLDDEGIEHYLVEIGGEVKCKGISTSDRFWRVGIDNPDYNKKPGAPQTILTLQIPSEMAVATSGNYRNYYTNENGQRIAHTIDARTGHPRQTNIISATVLHPSCTRADAMATMIMACGEADDMELKRLFARMGDLSSGVVIYSDKEGKTQIFKTENIEEFIVK